MDPMGMLHPCGATNNQQTNCLIENLKLKIDDIISRLLWPSLQA